MTTVSRTECDNCGYIQQSTNPMDETDVLDMFKCNICKGDYCEDCKNEHADEEIWL